MTRVSERQQIETLMASPAAFRERLMIDCDGQPRPLGKCLDDWQRADFEAIDSGLRRVVGQSVPNPVLRAMFIRPRGHSKSSDQGVSAAWLLFASLRKLTGIAAAADKEQAALLLNCIDTLCRLNRWLGEILEVSKDRVFNKRSGSTLTVISSDAASSFGHNPDFVILDELTHWRSRELFDSLISAAAKRASCMVLTIANAGFRESWQGKLVDHIRTDLDWFFRELHGPQASWITPARLEEQRRLLPPKTFARLWLNQWSDGTGDALDGADIDAAISLDAPLAGPEKGWLYCGGLDIGVSRDCSALIILGKHCGFIDRKVTPPKKLPGIYSALADLDFFDAPKPTIDYTRVPGSGRLKLAAVRIWSPQAGRVQLDEVQQEILNLHRQFKLVRLSFDPWQCELMAQNLRRAGLFCDPVNFNPTTLQSMAAATLTAFRERQLALFDHGELISDLRSMRVVEKGHGGFRLEMARGQDGGTQHGDAAQALALALESSRAIRGDQTSVSLRSLVY